jgi:CxxC motif-containing protein (DUF1111 family)
MREFIRMKRRYTTVIAAVAFLSIHASIGHAENARNIVEAPSGFDNRSNGFLKQRGPFPFDQLNEDNVLPGRSYDDNRFIFEEFEAIADGLGPVYNAQSCRECHQNVVTGGSSQIAELRVVTADGREPPGGTLIQSRAVDAAIVEQPGPEYRVRSFRLSTSTLGAGYVESIDDSTLQAISNAQPAGIRGLAVTVPVLEANGRPRLGRFGWKNQHASLLSFAADAYFNEMGITSALLPEESTSLGKDVSRWDEVAEPEDDGADLKAFADFIRATKAPPRGRISDAVRAGERAFASVGCAACHTPTLVTAAPGTPINGGTFQVPAALGNKRIHPYSDFLLHDIGTGDGIQTLSGPGYTETANRIRTAPLWGLRTRNRLMHDGLSFTLEDAISRHAGQAEESRNLYNALPAGQRNNLLEFLRSL